MKPDKFMCRIETIEEMNALTKRLQNCIEDINAHEYLPSGIHATRYYELTRASDNVDFIVDQLKDNLAVFPIVPPKFRLEIRNIVNRAELLMREYEDLA